MSVFAGIFALYRDNCGVGSLTDLPISSANRSINCSRSVSGADKARWRGCGRPLMQLRTGNFPKLIERLRLVRALGIEPERATRVHQNYWLKLAREGGQSTVQHLAELEPLRRYATLTALVLELTATLTDEALNMFEHLVGQLFKKSERAHAEQFHASGKSINEKVRLYARVGQALIEARSNGGDVFAAIEAVVPWPKFESTVAEAQTLAQQKSLTILRCSTRDTVACVSSRRSCSRILNSMQRRPRPSCCRLSICFATSMPAASARCPSTCRPVL
jgi:hypothetical protein